MDNSSQQTRLFPNGGSSFVWSPNSPIRCPTSLNLPGTSIEASFFFEPLFESFWTYFTPRLAWLGSHRLETYRSRACHRPSSWVGCIIACLSPCWRGVCDFSSRQMKRPWPARHIRIVSDIALQKCNSNLLAQSLGWVLEAKFVHRIFWRWRSRKKQFSKPWPPNFSGGATSSLWKSVWRGRLGILGFTPPT